MSRLSRVKRQNTQLNKITKKQTRNDVFKKDR